MRIFTVGAYPPYRRGSALFASELVAALPAVARDWHVDVCAVDPSTLARDDGTRLVVRRDHQPSYHHAAREIAAAGADLAVIQYDRQVFGGTHGAYLLDLTDELLHHGIPYAVTVHTVPDHPAVDERAQLAGLCHHAAAVFTFTAGARTVLCRGGIAAADRCLVLPRGAPRQLRRPFHVGALRPPVARALRRLRRTRLLTTLEPPLPERGLHHIVAALPAVVERHPDTVLLVAGSADGIPTARAAAVYTSRLRQLAAQLGVLDHVEFLDTYLSASELAAVLARTDLFLCAHPDVHRDSSGPLTYAFAAGRPVVSTAFRYATELFSASGSRAPGALVPCRDVPALVVAVNYLLDNPSALADAQAGARTVGASLMWDTVAVHYAKAFRRAVARSPVANAAA